MGGIVDLGSGNDILMSTSRIGWSGLEGDAGDRDRILLGEGDDIILSEDTISGLNAGEGNDVVSHSPLVAWSYGLNNFGNGNNQLFIDGSSGQHLIFGDGDDEIYGSMHIFGTVEGGGGNDILAARHIGGLMSMGEGNDLIIETSKDMLCYCFVDLGAGDDEIAIGIPTNGGIINGGAGEDIWHLPLGNDEIQSISDIPNRLEYGDLLEIDLSDGSKISITFDDLNKSW